MALTTIDFAITKYLNTVKLGRSEHTSRAYKNALNIFRRVLIENYLDPQTTLIKKLTEDVASPFVVHLKDFAPATEKLYLKLLKAFTNM